jgi:hypothetical protein
VKHSVVSTNYMIREEADFEVPFVLFVVTMTNTFLQTPISACLILHQVLSTKFWHCGSSVTSGQPPDKYAHSFYFHDLILNETTFDTRCNSRKLKWMSISTWFSYLIPLKSVNVPTVSIKGTLEVHDKQWETSY